MFYPQYTGFIPSCPVLSDERQIWRDAWPPSIQRQERFQKFHPGRQDGSVVKGKVRRVEFRRIPGPQEEKHPGNLPLVEGEILCR